MNIDDRLAVVKQAEVDCEAHATAARAGWSKLKLQAKQSATPWRIVTAGAITGFLMGRSGGGANNAPSVGSKLFGSMANMLITTLGASMTAGAAASSAADAAADATVDAVAEDSASTEAKLGEVKEAAKEQAEAEAQLHEDA
jgi:hypothetical protein